MLKMDRSISKKKTKIWTRNGQNNKGLTKDNQALMIIQLGPTSMIPLNMTFTVTLTPSDLSSAQIFN